MDIKAFALISIFLANKMLVLIHNFQLISRFCVNNVLFNNV